MRIPSSIKNNIAIIILVTLLICIITYVYINGYIALINTKDGLSNILIISILVLSFVLIIYFIWYVPKNLLKNSNLSIRFNTKDYHTAVKDYRTTNAQIVGGVLLFITAYLTLFQIKIQKENNDRLIATERIKIAQEKENNDRSLSSDKERLHLEQTKIIADIESNKQKLEQDRLANIDKLTLDQYQKAIELLKDQDIVASV